MTLKGWTLAGFAIVACLGTWVFVRGTDDDALPVARGPSTRGALDPRSDGESPEPELPHTGPGEGAAAPVLSNSQSRAPVREVLATASLELRGRVEDEGGEPIADADVALYRGNIHGEPIAQTRSDASGAFGWSLDDGDVELEELLVEGQRRGHVRAEAPFDEEGRCVVVLVTCPVVEGQLVPPDGVELVEPFAVEARREEDTVSGQVWADGSFAIPLPAPGRLVEVTGRARGLARSTVPVGRELGPGERVRVDVPLEAGVALAGRVVEAGTGRPIHGALVWGESYHHEDDEPLPAARTDAAGRFRLEGMTIDRTYTPDSDGAPTFGLFMLRASAEGYAPSSVQHAFAPLLARSGLLKDDVEIALEPEAATLEGLVLGPSGEPAPLEVVHALDSQQSFRFAFADMEGRFALEDLPAGVIHLMAFTAPNRSPEERASAQVAVDLVEGTQRVTLRQTAATGVLEGRCLDPSGGPIAGAAIVVRSRMSAESFAIGLVSTEGETDAEGYWRIEHLYPGASEVTVEGVADRPRAVARPPSAEVEIDPEVPGKSIVFTVADGIDLAGRIVGSGPSLVVVARAPDGSEAARVEPGSDGAFELGPLYPDSYDLVVLREGREVASTRVGPGSEEGIRLDVPDGG